ncbi:phage portal protein family protein, partial [Elizabethkingia miricola]|uniref:phage portal protein family protein n=1 Tax=Elizabethkingia miricola TaxID=172045 RepID=UPI003892C189
DAYQVYMQFRKSNDDEISKQIIGSTMLSDQGTNRSQTEVHERNLDNRIAQADKRVLQFIVNDQLFPLLRMQGYPISEDDVFEFKTAEQETKLTELWTITSGLLTQGFPVEQDWISKTFNIPFEGKKKNLTKPNVAAAYLPQNIKA